VFDPIDWMAVADRLMASVDESDLRAAIGRYYYAVFVKSRDSLERAGRLTAARSDADHRAVVEALKDARRGAAAANLERLRRLRNEADYDTSIEVTFRDARIAQTAAREIVRLCSPDWD